MYALQPLRPVLFILAGLLSSTTALAQGAPPFELDGEASKSVQVVRMSLGLLDHEEPASTDTEVEAKSPFQTTLNRRQENGLGGTGRLVMFPTGVAWTALFTVNGPVLPTEITEDGSGSFVVRESPNVTPGLLAPYLTIGTFDYAIRCGGSICHQFIEGPIESRAESSYAHVAGTLELDAGVETPDYGVTDDTRGVYHSISSTASARLGDWIYATGPGATATVVVDATLPVVLDEPDAVVGNGGPSDWVTQGSGNLLTLGCNSPIEPNVFQFTRFRLDFELSRWTFEEVCEEDGEGGELICNDEWVETLLGTQTVGRTREMTTGNCATGLELIPSDTGALPGAAQLQVQIPTNEWVQLYVTTSTDARCEGAMACALDARTSSPIEVSISSPNATLAAWHGVAGLTPVPEPGSAATLAAALAALVSMGRRRMGARRRD